jgi:sugar phosphate isomerase/epimerase
MKLAFTTLACPNWTLEQAADAAKRYGYEGLELRLLDGELLQPTMDAEARQRVRKVSADTGIPIMCVDTSVRIAQPDPSERAKQTRDGLAFLEIAAEWGAPFIRVFGGPPEGTAEADAISGATECLAALAKRGRELGVSAVLETHDAFCRSMTVMQIMNQVPGPGAGVLWDIMHPSRMGELAPDTLARFGDRLQHVHVKDGRRPADGGVNWDLTLLGEGEIPTRDILAALKKGGYTGWLSVEWEKKWHPEIEEPEVALPQHVEVLKEYLQGLG